MAAAGSVAVAGMIAQGLPWAQVLQTFAAYQLAAATRAIEALLGWSATSTSTIDPRAFAGVTSLGYAISEPLIATIDRYVPAPAEAIPAPWWDDASPFLANVARVVEGEIKDAARSAAGAAITVDEHWGGYVRMLVPPSCKRCVVLAGRVYRWNSGFSRHPPTCDCIHVPVAQQREFEADGFIADPMELFEAGQIRDLTAAEYAAIDDGADIVEVINANSGMFTADMFGRRLKATRYGTTKRSAWRKANPSRPIRLRPETIYDIVDREYDGDRNEARRLLGVYGYIKGDARAPERTASESDLPDPNRGFGLPPDNRDKDASRAYWQRRASALEGGAFVGADLIREPQEVRFVERMIERGHSLDWLPANPRRGKTNDFVWNDFGIEVELKTNKPRYRTIAHAIRSDVPPKRNFILDLEEVSLTDTLRWQLEKYNLRNPESRIERLWVLSENGRALTEIRLRNDE
ncbi:MAG: hypothetical protein ACI379_02705 [Nocardioides sp.]|uniref:VG15 protein n=1 Tax=Nocardioides sp. TaxID=35761 RepID=UPI003F0917AC